MSGSIISTAALIIPARDEEASIGATLDSAPRGLFRLIIVADNGSRDRTAAIARSRGAVVVHEPRKGYGAACLRALGAVPEDVGAVVFMQADGSEDAGQAAALLAPILDGSADLVLGSRTLGVSEPGALRPVQELGNRLATALVRWIWGHRYTDLGPFRAIRMDKLRELGMRDRGYGWTIEMQVKAVQKSLRIVEVPVTYRKRQAGEEKISGNWRAGIQAGAKILWTIARLALSG